MVERVAKAIYYGTAGEAMRRLWFIAGNFAVPVTEIPAHEMERLREGDQRICAYPVYWAAGLGTWPPYVSDGRVVQEIGLEEV